MSKQIKAIMKRMLIVALALLVCLTVPGCADEAGEQGQPPEGDTATQPTEDEGLKLVADGATEFIVMRSDYASQLYTNLSLDIQKAVAAVSGVTLALQTDYETREDDNTALYEILIGDTNRPESAAAKQELTEKDQYLIRISGHKVIIVANSDNAIKDAVAYFLSTYVGYKAEHDFTPATTITLEESEYKGLWVDPDIVPDDGKPDVLYGLSQDQVDEFFSDILEGLFTGKTVETITTKGIGASFGFHFPDIVYIDGKYMAYYITYKTDSGKGGVGLAISEDGKTWTDKGCVLQPDQEWDCNGAYFAGVWVDDDGLVYLVYESKGGENTEYGTLENVALAVSSDGGYSWEKEGVIIYADHDGSWWQTANVGTPDLYKVDDVWYVFFHGFDYVDCRLGVAYGEDLHELTIVEEPIINTEDDTLWSGTVGRRDVIFCDGYYYMVYEISTDQVADKGYGGAQWTHMFARSRDLITWEIARGPLLTQENPGFGYDGTCWMVVGKHLYVYMRQGGSTTAVELTLAE
ncbi:MAG: hypothetical protein IJW40_03855 [Clostridia bacterium]|nr:hypothetical protein [Clostridia bacterium]